MTKEEFFNMPEFRDQATITFEQIEAYFIGKRESALKAQEVELGEHHKIMAGARACAFAEWLDKEMYTQEDVGVWFNFPTQETSKVFKTSELYDRFIIETTGAF